ncbi:hypothetical protein BDV96DRAFT_67369 [Lophiotrema nucula]|uniref:Uncharacterized protein n=1 Tax=Lophiotrema nucula TaxID=690887 RepID=A0A6A5Z874_9PLEO|nr:hypothetical protein BDV96DRAFT_67369 [Lophiotrema nucula]
MISVPPLQHRKSLFVQPISFIDVRLQSRWRLMLGLIGLVWRLLGARTSSSIWASVLHSITIMRSQRVLHHDASLFESLCQVDTHSVPSKPTGPSCLVLVGIGHCNSLNGSITMLPGWKLESSLLLSRHSFLIASVPFAMHPFPLLRLCLSPCSCRLTQETALCL